MLLGLQFQGFFFLIFFFIFLSSSDPLQHFFFPSSSFFFKPTPPFSYMHKFIPKNKNPHLIFVILVFDLRILGFGFGFGFSMFVGFLVEVVVVLRVVGGGGCCCGFLGLQLVVVELRFGVTGYRCCIGRKCLVRGKRNPSRVPTISKQCGVSGWAPPFWQKVGLNFELFDWVMLPIKNFGVFERKWKLSYELWILSLRYELWVLSYENWVMAKLNGP